MIDACVKVLLVEDSPTDALLLYESLQDYPQQRFDVARAERLDEAVGLLAEESFDVVLLDLNLPDSQGIRTCERMARAAEQTPIIILTGADDESVAAEAMHLGVQDYLVKGCTAGNVIARTLRYAVERSRSQRALQESEERYRTLFTNMSEGFALGEAVFHGDGTACDFCFLDINDAFERQTGLTREILGRPMTEVLPNLEQHWIDTYCGVARTGQSVRFVRYNQDTGRHYDVFCYRPAESRFAILFRDVTERVQAEQVLQEAKDRLQDQTEKLQLQAEELQTQAEELRVTNESLQRREREYRTLAENTPEVIARFDRRLRHTYINEYGARVYGVPPRAVIGKTNAELGMPADKVAFWNDRFKQVLATGRQQTVDFEFDSPMMGHQYFSSLFVPEFDARGAVASILAITRDVTATREAQEALRESEGRLRRLIENLKGSHFVYLHDTNGVFRHLSESITGILGYTPDEFMAHYATYLTDHPANQAVHRCTERSIQGIRQPPYEVNIRHKDGSTRWLEVQEVPVFDDQGTVVAVEGVAQDITERKRAEEALRESEQWFRTLANTTPQLVWTADPDGRVDYYNERYREYQGIAPAGNGSFHWAPVLHPDDRERTVAAWERAVRTGEPYQIEHRVQRADGSYHWHLSRGLPVRDREGRIVKWFGTATDIDDLKQAQEGLHRLTETLESRVAQRTAELEHRTLQLQKLALELSEAEDRERRRLADVLHDDLQQQLAAVKFHLGRLGGRVRGDAVLRRTTALLDKMLAAAIETSRSLSHELSPATLYHSDLGETLEWLANQIRVKHGLDVHVHADGQINLESDALKAFLYKAAQEMLFNVVKHARVGQAWVRVRRVGRYVCLVVSDRGRGFNPQDLRATAGFGLFSIRERVQLLGGRMRIKSAVGKGSTFFIAVPDGPEKIAVGAGPRAYPASATPGDPGGNESDHGGSPLRVLVADDHEIVRQGLAALLREQEDIEFVGEAANGREAVDLASRLRPDVVIMDVAMPLMNGDEATRQTKMHLPGTRVIALSMYAEDGMVERMRQAGADCYILKTAPADELLAAVRGKKVCA